MPPREPIDRNLLQLECDLIDTLLAGLKRSRPDLSYPESHSDMTWAVQAVLEMFEAKRRPVPLKIKWTHESGSWCDSCRALTINRYGECSGCNSVYYNSMFYERMPEDDCYICPPGQKLNTRSANYWKCEKCNSTYEPTGKGMVLKSRGTLDGSQ